MEEVPLCTISVIYEYAEYLVTVYTNYTVEELQFEIFKSTGVPVDKQKIEHMIEGIGGMTVDEVGMDDDTILHLSEKPEVRKRRETELDRLTAYYEYYSALLPLGANQFNFRDGMALREHPRAGLGLLVLDERMICDSSFFRTPTDKIYARPHLLWFIKKVYALYDIAIWSTGPLDGLVKKLAKLNLLNHNDFEFVCLAGEETLSTVRIANVGAVKTKSLRKLWRIFRECRKFRTIICDVDANNYYLNQSNAILMSPYRYQPGQKDDDLLQLRRYLKHIAITYRRYAERDHTEWNTTPPPSCKVSRCSLL